MYIIDVTNPLTIGLLTIATGLLIFLGKEVKKPQIPAGALIFYLILIVVHSIQLATMSKILLEEFKSTLFWCLSFDLIMIFMTFFGYLWIDDVAAKFYKKKSIDNSLDWFWNKV